VELNRQVFKAPGIPKIGKKSVSSSKIRGALNPQSKLRKSTFSFVRPIGKNVDTEKISGGTAVASNLAETNNILVEIQKQLALDFAYRIAEEKKDLAAEKKRISAQKVADKEAKIEKSGKNLLGKTFSKAIAPAKSIFQKLIDFFSIILTGILFNTAFKWLSKEENREKLKKFFNFLKDYWQELLIIFGAYKLARLVGKIDKIGKTFKKLFDIFKKKPPKLPCKCPKTSPTTDACKQVFNCMKNPSLVVVSSLATALAVGGYILGQGSLDLLKGLLGGGLIPGAAAQPVAPIEPAPVLAPIEPAPAPALPFQDIYDLGNNSILKSLADIGNSREFQIGTILTALTVAGVGVALPDPPTTAGGLAAIGPLLAKLKLLMTGPKLALAGGALSLTPMMAMAKDRGIEIPENEIAGQIVQYFGKSKAELLKIYKDKNAKPVERVAAERTLIEQYNVKLDPPEFSRGGTVPGYKNGGTFWERLTGTVQGVGSGLVDSVKALLAPGEEIIRASMAKLFRPLLKNINDKGGKEWLAFSGGVATLLLNNRIQSELNRDFKKVIVKFTELVEEQIAAEKKRKRRRNNNGGNGGYRPQTAINMKKPTMPKRSGGGSDLGVNMMQNIVVNQTPVSVSNNVLQPNINKSGIVVVPITVGDLQAKKQQPKVNVINLPPKTMNLAPKQGSVKTPSSGSATEVPSISPVDAGNPYISSLRLEYGMVM